MRIFRLIGSLGMAVPLLVVIASVLAWGTIYETRFGTAAVQRFVYQSGWFQALLGFLAVNLAAAAFSRLPWQRRHLPFLLAHLGIILVLVGGILGGRLGVEGQMIIPEGEASSTLQLARNVLVVHQPNPGIYQELETRFETTAWNHRPHALFEVPLKDRSIQLVVDRYYPNAERREEVSDSGDQENPALRLTLSHEGEEGGIWLLARDPDRFGARWGEAHVFFLEAQREGELKQLLGSGRVSPSERGTIEMEFPGLGVRRQIPIPTGRGKMVQIEGTPYRLTFRDYFPDFALSEKGPVSRSAQPNNPAVAFTLTGPEGTDAHLLFALHPEFEAVHGRRQKIHAHLQYRHPVQSALPPDSIALVRASASSARAGATALSAILTDSTGKRQPISRVELGAWYTHPALGYRFRVEAFYSRAQVEVVFGNRDNEVRSEAIHLVGRDGDRVEEAWLALRQAVALPLGEDSPTVEYRPAVRELPFTVRLEDFRKIDYPGTQMAAGFESDVELTDPERGVTLKKKISMNNPLKHRGFSLFQSSYIQGEREATVLSVRKDPGTPLVYAGFLIVLSGVILLFTSRSRVA